MKNKNLGKLTISATGLRKMASALEKKYKTKSDVKINTFIVNYKNGKTIGIELK